MSAVAESLACTTLHRPGIGISKTAERLRTYAFIERKRIRVLAGWFLRIGDYETKYRVAYHLYDSCEHVGWLRRRLSEMRAGNPEASVRPELGEFLERTLDAPSDEDFLMGFHGVLTRALQEAIARDLLRLDPAANANEVRILRRIQDDLTRQLEWYGALGFDEAASAWHQNLRLLLASVGGLHGEVGRQEISRIANGQRFERPRTIVFDQKITVGPLSTYEDRLEMEPREATIEQFKVFFNEFYAAALLASVLFDAAEGAFPWEFHEDFCRHFWDEARHSEFGAIRLHELGVEPDRVNPVLFEEAENLPILHRIAYLTRGLEAYFMPRKPKRMKEYEQNGDPRSQLFADQDWSDEINRVRFGSRWVDFLLQDDHREVDDIIEEVRQHLAVVRGRPVESINAPF